MDARDPAGMSFHWQKTGNRLGERDKRHGIAQMKEYNTTITHTLAFCDHGTDQPSASVESRATHAVTWLTYAGGLENVHA